jgi:phosphatidylethanolamine/phosphatidyl-N-methylethanolamine N-methyltransferase
MSIWTEYGAFWRETRRHFRTTGAVLPSSPFLARALVAPLNIHPSPARILEVGPGTGAVTRAIARRMRDNDRLDAVELNLKFVEQLRRRLDREPAFANRRDQIRLIHSAVEDLPGEAVYDYIVSGLPFNSFPSTLVRRIFQAYSRLLKPGGTLTYFEYVLVRQIQTPFVNRIERRRLYRVGRVVDQYIKAFQVHRERVFMNVPPAIVRHLHLKPPIPAIA